MAKQGTLFSFSFTSVKKSWKDDEEEQAQESSEAAGHRFPSDRREGATTSSSTVVDLDLDEYIAVTNSGFMRRKRCVKRLLVVRISYLS